MKKTVLFGMALMSLLVVAKASFAADYKLGLKLWANTWRETIHPQAGESQDFDNGNALMAGPSLAVQLPGKWFANATYLTTPGAYKSSDWIVPGDTMKFKRNDLDLRIGRMFQPSYFFRPDPDVNFGVYIGYKMIDAPASYTNTAAGFTDFRIGTWKQKGYGIGFLADIPLSLSTRVYGDLAFFNLKQEFKLSIAGRSQPFNASGVDYELGVAHTINEAFSAHVGFKGEQSSGTEESGVADRNDFNGLIAGIDYSF
jgi:hypothetical protein